jgi:hypothetical protein
MLIASSEISGWYDVEPHSIDVSLPTARNSEAVHGGLPAGGGTGRKEARGWGLDAVWTGAGPKESHPLIVATCVPWEAPSQRAHMRLSTKPTCNKSHLERSGGGEVFLKYLGYLPEAT